MNVQNIVVAGKSGAGKQPRVDVLVQAYGLAAAGHGKHFSRVPGHFNKVRGDAKTDGLWSDGKFAADAAIRQALAPACAKRQ